MAPYAIKKAASSQWMRADFNTSLEKGDFVQTGSDGVARIIFADGTNYTLKPDALIVVEESREDPVTRATKVAVQVTSGAVDLATGHFETPGSTSQVSFADAVASLNEESRAAVRNDPDKNVHEITVDSGQAEVTRGSTSIQLGQYEQVSFAAEQPGLVRNKVIAPPSLLTPPEYGAEAGARPQGHHSGFQLDGGARGESLPPPDISLGHAFQFRGGQEGQRTDLRSDFRAR